MGDDEDSSSYIDRARMSIDSNKILAKVKREEQFIGKTEVQSSNASSYQLFEMQCNPALSFKYKVPKQPIEETTISQVIFKQLEDAKQSSVFQSQQTNFQEPDKIIMKDPLLRESESTVLAHISPEITEN